MTGMRVFVSFAVEDVGSCERRIREAVKNRCSVEFVRMPVNQPFDGPWRIRCRARILGSAGLIALISPNTTHSDRQLWEVRCADAGDVPVLLVLTSEGKPPAELPPLIARRTVQSWRWADIASFLETI